MSTAPESAGPPERRWIVSTDVAPEVAQAATRMLGWRKDGDGAALTVLRPGLGRAAVASLRSEGHGAKMRTAQDGRAARILAHLRTVGDVRRSREPSEGASLHQLRYRERERLDAAAGREGEAGLILAGRDLGLSVRQIADALEVSPTYVHTQAAAARAAAGLEPRRPGRPAKASE